MQITITAGYWLIPLLLTIISFFIANDYKKHNCGYINCGYINCDFEGLIRFLIAIIFSLIVWLIWALLN